MQLNSKNSIAAHRALAPLCIGLALFVSALHLGGCTAARSADTADRVLRESGWTPNVFVTEPLAPGHIVWLDGQRFAALPIGLPPAAAKSAGEVAAFGWSSGRFELHALLPRVPGLADPAAAEAALRGAGVQQVDFRFSAAQVNSIEIDGDSSVAQVDRARRLAQEFLSKLTPGERNAVLRAAAPPAPPAPGANAAALARAGADNPPAAAGQGGAVTTAATPRRAYLIMQTFTAPLDVRFAGTSDLTGLSGLDFRGVRPTTRPAPAGSKELTLRYADPVPLAFRALPITITPGTGRDSTTLSIASDAAWAGELVRVGGE